MGFLVSFFFLFKNCSPPFFFFYTMMIFDKVHVFVKRYKQLFNSQYIIIGLEELEFQVSEEKICLYFLCFKATGCSCATDLFTEVLFRCCFQFIWIFFVVTVFLIFCKMVSFAGFSFIYSSITPVLFFFLSLAYCCLMDIFLCLYFCMHEGFCGLLCRIT